MTFVIHEYAVPLRIDEKGTVRVGQTRVTLDTLIGAYHMGQTPDQIASSYDTLTLADIHHVIAYYLREKEAVDAYLAEREREAEGIRRKIEQEFPPQELYERLMARKREQEGVPEVQ
jgi:uncharacterized protein (DUF433 family)